MASIADARRDTLIAVGVGVLLSGLLGYWTFRRIAPPIRSLKTTVETIAGGDYSRDVPFARSPDELGDLARSVDVLKRGAMAMDEQRWVKTHAARITGELQGAATLDEFGSRLVSTLVPVLGGGVAAFYRLRGRGREPGAAPHRGLRFGSGGSGTAAIGGRARGSVRAGAQAGEPRGHPRGRSAHRVGRGRGGSGPGDGLAGDVPGRAPRGPRVRVVSPARRKREGPARRAVAGRRDEPRDPGPQHPDAGAPRPDAGAGAAARSAAGGARGRAGKGRGSHAAEVDVSRQHEPRDPDSDERDHRPLAPRAEDPDDSQAAGLHRQGPQRRDIAARDHQRHPGFLEDRGGEARPRDDAVPARRGDLDGHDRDRTEGAREGPRVSGRRPGLGAAGPAGRPPAPRPDPDEPRQQRREVHRAGRDPAEGGAARADRRAGQAALFGHGHGRRHDAGAGRAPLPALHPGRHVDDPQARGHGSRADDLQAARGVDGRPDLARERARRGEHVLLHRLAGPRHRGAARPVLPERAAASDHARRRRQPRRPRDPGRRVEGRQRSRGRRRFGRGGGRGREAARRLRSVRRRFHGLADARRRRAGGDAPDQERYGPPQAAGRRHGDGVRPGRGARGGREARRRGLSLEARHEVDAGRRARLDLRAEDPGESRRPPGRRVRAIEPARGRPDPADRGQPHQPADRASSSSRGSGPGSRSPTTEGRPSGCSRASRSRLRTTSS